MRATRFDWHDNLFLLDLTSGLLAWPVAAKHFYIASNKLPWIRAAASPQRVWQTNVWVRNDSDCRLQPRKKKWKAAISFHRRGKEERTQMRFQKAHYRHPYAWPECLCGGVKPVNPASATSRKLTHDMNLQRGVSLFVRRPTRFDFFLKEPQIHSELEIKLISISRWLFLLADLAYSTFLFLCLRKRLSKRKLWLLEQMDIAFYWSMPATTETARNLLSLQNMPWPDLDKSKRWTGTMPTASKSTYHAMFGLHNQVWPSFVGFKPAVDRISCQRARSTQRDLTFSENCHHS